MSWKRIGTSQQSIKWRQSTKFAYLSAPVQKWLLNRCPNPFEPHIEVLQEDRVPGTFGLRPCAADTPGSFKLTRQGISATFWYSVSPEGEGTIEFDDEAGMAIVRVNQPVVTKGA